MSFTITLLNNKSETNRIIKTTETLGDFTGTLRDGTSILNPIILVSGDISDFVNANYMHIPVFDRYYFINDISSVRNGLFEIRAHVDVLSTYGNEIVKNQAIVSRQANQYNLYLNDGSFRTYQNPVITTHKFPYGFSGQNFVLAVAGGATVT